MVNIVIRNIAYGINQEAKSDRRPTTSTTSTLIITIINSSCAKPFAAYMHADMIKQQLYIEYVH